MNKYRDSLLIELHQKRRNLLKKRRLDEFTEHDEIELTNIKSQIDNLEMQEYYDSQK